MSRPILEVRDLRLSFGDGRGGRLAALDGIDFTVPEGRTLCLVGESGCGKSVTARAVMQLLDEGARIDGGSLRFAGRAGEADLARLDPKGAAMRRLRGAEIAMIYQEPMTALSPLWTIGAQIGEVLRVHRGLSRKAARTAAIDMLAEVGMPDPERRVDAYSFELSGGQRQRAVIAMALIGNPRLLIADEPTTALDVTTQAAILALLRRLQQERGMSMIFITHDLGVVSEIGDEVAVMYMGRVAEQGPADRILADPRHPYTRGLLASLPPLRGPRHARLPAIAGTVPPLSARPAGCAFAARCAHALLGRCEREKPALQTLPGDRARAVACHALDAAGRLPAPGLAASQPPRPRPDYTGPPLLRVEHLTKHFSKGRGPFRAPQVIEALSEVSFDLWPGETLGLVGESGCGKSTLGRTLIGLDRASAGSARLAGGTELTGLSGAAQRAAWQRIRMVFQDPNGSFNPRLSVFDIIAEVLRTSGTAPAAIEARVREVAGFVGLGDAMLDRFPHAFSGGQRQRIGIARALAPAPQILIADEAVSALDVSVQAQVLNLFADLQVRLGLAYLFISHDLSVVRHVSDRVAVMYAGRIVETAPTDQIFARPRHPYTALLLDSVPEPGRRSAAMPAAFAAQGVPDPARLPQGCAFAGRCPRADALCHARRPTLPQAPPGAHLVACHHPVADGPVAIEQSLACPA